MSKIPLTSETLTDDTPYSTPPFSEIFLSNPYLFSTLLRFVPWKDFLSLSQTGRIWRGFFQVRTSKAVKLRNIVLTRYVDEFAKALHDAGQDSALREDFGPELCWEDLVLLVISQQTPSTQLPYSCSIGTIVTLPQLARLALAHSRFVLVLQSISYSSSNPPPQEDESPVASPGNSYITEPSRGHHRASSAGSVRELIFPTPLTAAEHPAILASKSMTNVNVVPPVYSSTNSLSKDDRRGSKGRSMRPSPSTSTSTSTGSSWSGSSSSLPTSATTPSASPTLKANKRLSMASVIGKSSRTPPPPAMESRALRAYSSSFGWRRGLSDAKGRWEAVSSYRSAPLAPGSLHREFAEEIAGYGSELDNDDLFSTPRRRFVGSDARISGSESSFSEGTSSELSSSTSASNSTSATSISGLDGPPPLLQKDSLSRAEALAMNRGRVRPPHPPSAHTNVDMSSTRSGSASRSRPPSRSTTLSDVSPPHSSTSGSKSGLSSRTSTLGPGILRPPMKDRERLRSMPSANGFNPDHHNPHALHLAMSRIRAPILRVFVPSSDMSLPRTGEYPDDISGVSMCEEELLRAGLWDHLSVGDVSPSVAVWLIYNGYQLVPFTPGAQDSRGILPVYTTPGAIEGEGQEAWALPSWGYYDHLLPQDARSGPGGPKSNTGNINLRILLSKIPVSPLHHDMMHEPTLISVTTRVPSPHSPGGIVIVKKWVWSLRISVGSSSKFSSSSPVRNDSETEVGPGWEGEWVLEVDGTKEGKELLLSCVRQEQPNRDLMEWELIRERCGRGKVCLRYV
ncbi:hypothetical protein BT96DRAFT_988689 [Gymnopus androsaceus JB14]|uniref:F-box domain-containing protein n=1 Tax=Gymnopus androsaceus JB14 TaxID=1447944 RepID=A0A6A4I5G0_9AGAR|nr:hypothetical protein BT96DRAFT_988689 [Gymnopus androsaceus JB14]